MVLGVGDVPLLVLKENQSAHDLKNPGNESIY